MFQIAVQSTFSAAHALRLTDGSFEPMHGHDWRVTVTVQSPVLDCMDCVMDFHRLQSAVEQVVGPWRNRTLNDVRPFARPDQPTDRDKMGDCGASGASGASGGLEINPSAERVAEVIAKAVESILSPGVRLLSVEVGESPGCKAIYLCDT